MSVIDSWSRCIGTGSCDKRCGYADWRSLGPCCNIFLFCRSCPTCTWSRSFWSSFSDSRILDFGMHLVRGAQGSDRLNTDRGRIQAAELTAYFPHFGNLGKNPTFPDSRARKVQRSLSRLFSQRPVPTYWARQLVTRVVTCRRLTGTLGIRGTATKTASGPYCTRSTKDVPTTTPSAASPFEARALPVRAWYCKPDGGARPPLTPTALSGFHLSDRPPVEVLQALSPHPTCPSTCSRPSCVSLQICEGHLVIDDPVVRRKVPRCSFQWSPPSCGSPRGACCVRAPL